MGMQLQHKHQAGQGSLLVCKYRRTEMSQIHHSMDAIIGRGGREGTAELDGKPWKRTTSIQRPESCIRWRAAAPSRNEHRQRAHWPGAFQRAGKHA